GLYGVAAVQPDRVPPAVRAGGSGRDADYRGLRDGRIFDWLAAGFVGGWSTGAALGVPRLVHAWRGRPGHGLRAVVANAAGCAALVPDADPVHHWRGLRLRVAGLHPCRAERRRLAATWGGHRRQSVRAQPRR